MTEKNCNAGGRKNQYIRKINSLLQISQQSNTHIPKQKIIQKTQSLINKDKNQVSKKENNRVSAKKARQRKKIYVTLLEKAVKNLQKLKYQGQMIQQQSDNFLGKCIYEEKRQYIQEQFGDISVFLNDIHKSIQKKSPLQQDMDQKIDEMISLLFPLMKENFKEILVDEGQRNYEKINLQIQKDIKQLRQINEEAQNLFRVGLNRIKVQSNKQTDISQRQKFIKEMIQEDKMDMIDLQKQKLKQIEFQKIQKVWQKMQSFLDLNLKTDY